MNIFIRLNWILEKKNTNRVSTSHKKNREKGKKIAQDERESRVIKSIYCI
jgi:hypothetical protein